MKTKKTTVVAFHERKLKIENTPKPIRPPALDGQPPTKEQLAETLNCFRRFLFSDDMDEVMLAYRMSEALSIVMRTSPGLNELTLMELVVLRKMLNQVMNNIKAIE